MMRETMKNLESFKNISNDVKKHRETPMKLVPFDLQSKRKSNFYGGVR